MRAIKLLRGVSLVLIILVPRVVIRNAVPTNMNRARNSVSHTDCSWPLPFLPSDADRGGPVAFENVLHSFVRQEDRCYRHAAGWKQDDQIRDTGPFIDGQSYGTHRAVRTYYSPEIWTWLNNGGDIPDGATIVKEMYEAPARQDRDQNVIGLAIMVRDQKGAWDGWFWSDGEPSVEPGDMHAFDYYPNAGFGLYCVNCHSSAEKSAQTYAALRNINGDPISYNPTMVPNLVVTQRVPKIAFLPQLLSRQSDTKLEGINSDLADIHERISSLAHEPETARPPSASVYNNLPPSASVYNKIIRSEFAPPPSHQFQMEWNDNVTQGSRPNGQKDFLTSNQCIGCHDATQSNPSIPNMVYPQIYQAESNKVEETEVDLNLSPYSEWRASLMGLAGRDPVFYAQLESEEALHPELRELTDNACLSCHAVMGQRQYRKDHDDNMLFVKDLVNVSGLDPNAKYGALARDGVSCLVCHRILPDGLGKPETFTGRFKLSPSDDGSIFGPFTDVVTTPMKNALGLTPMRGDQIKSAKLCGSCHTIILPALIRGEKYDSNPYDDPQQKSVHEQDTYLEWLNSNFQNEIEPIEGLKARTCQDCHMPTTYAGNQLAFKIANIEDETFPALDNRIQDTEIHLRVRGIEREEPYSRHTFVGANVFTMQMFQQFSESLGIRTWDPMASYGTFDSKGKVPGLGLVTAEKSSVDLAHSATAKIEITSLHRSRNGLVAHGQSYQSSRPQVPFWRWFSPCLY
jgi:hypothetical protein